MVVFCPLRAGVSSEKLRRANMDPVDWEKVIAAADRMSKPSSLSMIRRALPYQDMRSKLRRLKVEHGLDLVIVDYIQLMLRPQLRQGQREPSTRGV